MKALYSKAHILLLLTPILLLALCDEIRDGWMRLLENFRRRPKMEHRDFYMEEFENHVALLSRCKTAIEKIEISLRWERHWYHKIRLQQARRRWQQQRLLLERMAITSARIFVSQPGGDVYGRFSRLTIQWHRLQPRSIEDTYAFGTDPADEVKRVWWDQLVQTLRRLIRLLAEIIPERPWFDRRQHYRTIIRFIFKNISENADDELALIADRYQPFFHPLISSYGKKKDRLALAGANPLRAYHR